MEKAHCQPRNKSFLVGEHVQWDDFLMPDAHYASNLLLKFSIWIPLFFFSIGNWIEIYKINKIALDLFANQILSQTVTNKAEKLEAGEGREIGEKFLIRTSTGKFNCRRRGRSRNSRFSFETWSRRSPLLDQGLGFFVSFFLLTSLWFLFSSGSQFQYCVSFISSMFT